MKVVVQRVNQASVSIGNKVINRISEGLLLLLGIEKDDNYDDSLWLVNKIINLRLFSDTEMKMNHSILDINGEILVISQFTLHAKIKNGNRPSFVKAAKPDYAKPLYDHFIGKLNASLEKDVKSGIFGENMKVKLINNGPVTIVIDTKNKQ
ncbi:MAG: D-tyrosyl-tRNA(Tyr) deacylase [Flavobacteriales bacterium]|jgi:D-tyrosyl-tRNA(Tyr) deacylase|nr:D-tyrosyl-tRNA(Tyr) deacylase [Flavobacteriales bacterium]